MTVGRSLASLGMTASLTLAVIPSERSPNVIPSERSESRNLHLAPTDP
jgi:hypothetical protein